jgi:hypothetical protein
MRQRTYDRCASTQSESNTGLPHKEVKLTDLCNRTMVSSSFSGCLCGFECNKRHTSRGGVVDVKSCEKKSGSLAKKFYLAFFIRPIHKFTTTQVYQYP